MKRITFILFVLFWALNIQGQVDTTNYRGNPHYTGGEKLTVVTNQLDANDIYLEIRSTPDSVYVTVTSQRYYTDTTIALPNWSAGGISYDTASRTNVSDMGVPGVRCQIGEEMYYLVVNNTGSTVLNGKAAYASGVDAVTGLIEIGLADASSSLTSLQTLGLVTADILDGQIGLVTEFGIVRDWNTSHLNLARVAYLDTIAGELTSAKPLSPDKIVIVGTTLKVDAAEGQVHVVNKLFTRPMANKSYSFTSNGIGAGTYYLGGFYDAPSADANLNQGSASVTHGSANDAYSAHAFIVAGGAGSVNTGQVGLRIRGTSITDAGDLVATDTVTITDDITTLSTDDYSETAKKWLGTGTFELYVVSGSPTTYSLDFNYGYAKYDDLINRDFSINTIEVVGLAGASDADFDITLLHHKATGWAYAASGFEPGNSEIASWSGTLGPNDDLVNNEHFAWKLLNLDTFINGDSDEGVIVKVITGTNNSVQSMDVHLFGEIETF